MITTQSTWLRTLVTVGLVLVIQSNPARADDSESALAQDTRFPSHLTGTDYINAAVYENQIDSYIESLPDYNKFKGVILVAQKDTIYLNKGYGFASLEFNIQNSPKTRFQIGSITKAFTSMLVLKMVERGLINLDSSICSYLPYYPEKPENNITIRHLLSHTSGLPHHYEALPDFIISDNKYFHTPKELISLFSSIPVVNSPGKEFSYSSPGFYILGAILQRVTNKSYAELLQEYIFSPLNMKHTKVENNRTVYVNMATGYRRGLKGLVRAGIEDKSTALAAGDLVSDSYDLYIWSKTLSYNADQILSAESKKLLFASVLPGHIMTFAGPRYEIPFDQDRKILTVSVLTGSSEGYAAYLSRVFELEVTIIVLSNVQDTDVSRIGDDVGDIFIRHHLGIEAGHPAPLVRTMPLAKEIKDVDVETKFGFYKSENHSFTSMLRVNGRIILMSYSKGGFMERMFEIIPKSPDSFYMGYDSRFECQFSNDNTDNVILLNLVRNGRTFLQAKKVEDHDPGIEFHEYEGYYTSVELQQTFRFLKRSNTIVAENFLNGADNQLIPLTKDLFGFDQGFMEFFRDIDGTISGFKLITMNTDSFFGSKFVKISD